MKVNIIVAIASNGVIGGENKLLWHLPADLKYFKQLTTNHTIIMGRKTYESIGRALPNRINIVISRKTDFSAEGCFIANSLENALQLAASFEDKNIENDEQSVFIIGGAQIYSLALPITQKLFVTEVKHSFEGDTYFEKIDAEIWKEVEREQHFANEKNIYDYDFVVYQRIKLN
jgi:dihydrofolate reductase